MGCSCSARQGPRRATQSHPSGGGGKRGTSSPSRSETGWPVWLPVLALAMVLAPAVAVAHNRSISFSSWQLAGDGTAEASVRVSARDLDALRAVLAARGQGERPAAYLSRSIGWRAQSRQCPLDGPAWELPSAGLDGDGGVVFHWRVDCRAARGSVRLRSDALFDVVAGHLHLATVRAGDGRIVAEVALSESQRDGPLLSMTSDTARPVAPSGTLAMAARYLRLGVEHILSGLDHVVFLLVLLVGLTRLRDIGLAVTGFTLGHSTTLALASLGYAEPQMPAIEALIGASIALVAAENVWLTAGRRSKTIPAGVLVALLAVTAVAALWGGAVPVLALVGMALFSGCYFGLLGRVQSGHVGRMRLAVAAVFGLVHGFGFAGPLAEMGLPTAHLAVALAGFNLGVELGQLAVVLIVGALLATLGSAARQRVTYAGSAVAAALGTFWFVGRAFG